MWSQDIKMAQEAHLDAFALNMGYADPANPVALEHAFSAAEEVGFNLFFSFDYAGHGAWPESDVINLITQYSSSPAYYHYNGQPFVSTFEGPGNADDWFNIKSQTNCFFIPTWSSLGAKAALELGVADGLFSWAAWPWGNEDMNTYTDASYLQYLSQMPYMMPASPWFYTNLPGYHKNWVWNGDNLWYDRWQEIFYIRPEFVEIISWNDYGESHYIGPLYDEALGAFNVGKAPFNYAKNMPHDGWRQFLPYVIDTYKNGISTITSEGIVAWYRLNPSTACGSGGTSGNTASQLQIEFPPDDIVEDRIFFSALLGSPADVTVSIGGQSLTGIWRNVPDQGIGVWQGWVPITGVGDVVVTLSRDGTTIAQFNGEAITNDCSLVNWNAWVGNASSSSAISVTPSTSLDESVCVNGTGAYNFAGICEFACTYGYCPWTACTCTEMGIPRLKPNATGVQGYPIAGEDASYAGLCSFDCSYGYCPDTACGIVSAPLSTPTVSDFSPPACIGGTGEGNLMGLCSYGCQFGFCPIDGCTCTAEGALVTPPAATSTISGIAVDPAAPSVTSSLCSFACERGYCPSGACTTTSAAATATANPTSGPGSGDVYVDPSIWGDPEPVVGCIPPCNMIFPPYSLLEPTVIVFPPWTTTLTPTCVTTRTTTYDDGVTETIRGIKTITETTVITFPPGKEGSIMFR